MENENEQQVKQMENNAENLLGIETPKYQQIELGGWKPKLGLSSYEFGADRIEVRSSKDGSVYKTLKVVLKPVGEQSVKTFSLVWKDNPNPRSNLGRWIKFRQTNELKPGMVLMISRKAHEINPEWSEYDFHIVEVQKPATA